MILLDTNVISEMMRPSPDPIVINWLDAQIAAIALFGKLTLASRNERDFTGIEGLDVVNPWK